MDPVTPLRILVEKPDFECEALARYVLDGHAAVTDALVDDLAFTIQAAIEAWATAHEVPAPVWYPK